VNTGSFIGGVLLAVIGMLLVVFRERVVHVRERRNPSLIRRRVVICAVLFYVSAALAFVSAFLPHSGRSSGNSDPLAVTIGIVVIVGLWPVSQWMRSGGFLRWRSTKPPAAGGLVIAALVAVCVVEVVITLR
jgi:hypothetical protein